MRPSLQTSPHFSSIIVFTFHSTLPLYQLQGSNSYGNPPFAWQLNPMLTFRYLQIMNYNIALTLTVSLLRNQPWNLEVDKEVRLKYGRSEDISFKHKHLKAPAFSRCSLGFRRITPPFYSSSSSSSSAFHGLASSLSYLLDEFLCISLIPLVCKKSESFGVSSLGTVSDGFTRFFCNHSFIYTMNIYILRV
jgi:hypothetical protein